MLELNVILAFLGALSALLVARFFAIHHEALVLGGFFVFTEGWHFYLEKTVLPSSLHLPEWFLAFVGAYLVTGAFLIIGRFIPGVKVLVGMIANG